MALFQKKLKFPQKNHEILAYTLNLKKINVTPEN